MLVVWIDCPLGVVGLSASSVGDGGGFLCSKMSLMKKERILLGCGVISFMFVFENTKTRYDTHKNRMTAQFKCWRKIWMKENFFVYKRKLEFTQVSMIDMVLRPYRILILSTLWFPFMIKQTSPNQTSKWVSHACHAYSTARMKLFKTGIASGCNTTRFLIWTFYIQNWFSLKCCNYLSTLVSNERSEMRNKYGQHYAIIISSSCQRQSH